MSLMTFHKAFIIAAMVFFVGYGTWELYHYFIPSDDVAGGADTVRQQIDAVSADSGARMTAALWTGLAMYAGAIVLGFYLAWIMRNARRTST
ncbi:MAG: hypothetical protein ACF8PN_14330 [Phycisphaerales bacterium]